MGTTSRQQLCHKHLILLHKGPNFHIKMGSLSADQLSDQLLKIQKNLSEPELVADNKVVQNFLDLCLPVDSEVLELCAETGNVSACIQSRGYNRVDVLNEDMPTLRKLEKNNIYRNYIWREVSGIGSTGLREESYDVVLTSGGFACNAMSPNDITETLRILRPEGFMIWSMKTAQAEHSTEFGLFEQNLTSLVKAGKCTLVKHEIFTDKKNRTLGELYVVKRLAGRFPDYLDRPTPKVNLAYIHNNQTRFLVSKWYVFNIMYMNKGKFFGFLLIKLMLNIYDHVKELQEQIEQMLVDDADPEHTAKFYDDWSEKYDDDLVVVGNYSGFVKVAEAFIKLGLNHEVQILDLAAGTGLLGAEIGRHGYTNIDGLDSSLGMLGKARSQGIFKNYINARLDGLGSIPVNDETYDVIASSNGFAPGQIYPSSLPELLRVLRPGGYIIIAMKDGYQHTSQKFALMDTVINDLVVQNQLEILLGPVVFKNFLLNKDGRFYMMRKLASHTYACGSPLASPKQSRRGAQK